MLAAVMFSPITGIAYVIVGGLSVGAAACLVGTTRQAWALNETSVGVVLLALTLLVHGVVITGASTFGPTPVLVGQVDGFRCADIRSQSCEYVDISTGRGYLIDARLPRPVRFDQFYRGDKKVTAQISIWDAHIHWMRTENTDPPTTVGYPPRINYLAVTKVFAALTLACLAVAIWREARRRGTTRESDPFVLLKKMP